MAPDTAGSPDEMHERHMRHCKITTLAGHKFGWDNCPDFICSHCGSPPDADGDHSCPCPYSDEECPGHACSDCGLTGCAGCLDGYGVSDGT